VRREAGKAFADGIEDTDIKVQLLLGGKKTEEEALKQAVLLATKPRKTSARTFWESPHPGEETKDNSRAVAVGSRATSRATSLTKRREKTNKDAGDETTDAEVTNGSRREGTNGTQETNERPHEEMTDPRETRMCCGKGGSRLTL
jgi:hypothetical protein